MRQKTEFARYSHVRLYQMLHHGDEAVAREVAASWDGVGARLHEQANDLEARLTAFRQQWRGRAAEQYQLMINDLSAGLRRIGDTAFTVRDVAHDAADALVTAKERMPEPVAVPEVSPRTVLLAAATPEVSPFAPADEVERLRQWQTTAAEEVARYREATRASDAAHAEAVAVMNDLAVAYLVADDALPVAPTTAQQAAAPAEEDEELGRWARHRMEAVEQAETETEPEGPVVFGSMFVAGVAAAAAASSGRLGMRTKPRVPGWAKQNEKSTKPERKTPPDAEPRAAGGLGGVRVGGGIGGGLSGLGGAPPAAAAHAGMTGPATPDGTASSALRAAAGAAGVGRAAMPFMPFMPFAPTGGDSAGARRVPPWLTETEEVWGETNAVAPPVLGEDPPERQRRQPDYPY